MKLIGNAQYLLFLSAVTQLISLFGHNNAGRWEKQEGASPQLTTLERPPLFPVALTTRPPSLAKTGLVQSLYCPLGWVLIIPGTINE